jgi:hypothetical protein
LQDTSSQSIDGTKEVTQEHNVQAQLDKYNKEQAAKLAEHNEKLLKYHRKYPSRKKTVDHGPSDVPAKSSEECSAPGSPKKKFRLAVAKISFSRASLEQIPTGRSPRRSPHIVSTRQCSNLRSNLSDHHASTLGSKSLKRRRIVDETYVPDNDDDDVFAEEASVPAAGKVLCLYFYTLLNLFVCFLFFVFFV